MNKKLIKKSNDCHSSCCYINTDSTYASKYALPLKSIRLIHGIYNHE